MNRISLLFPLTAFCCGILLSESGHLLYGGILLCVLAILTYFLLIRKKVSPLRRMSLNRYHLLWISVLFVGLGIITGSLSVSVLPGDSDLERIKVVEGKIKDKRYSTSGDVLTIDVDRLYFADRSLADCSGMTLIVYSDDATADIDDTVIFPAAISKITDSGNSFDSGYASMLGSKGIFHSACVPGRMIEVTGHSPTLRGFFRHIRDDLVMAVEKSRLATKTKNFLITIMFGDRAYLDPGQRQLFSNAGVAHVLALSGMHIGIIAGIFMWLLFPINFFGLYRYRSLLTVFLLWGYALVTGMAPSTVRACVMASFVMAAMFLERKNSAFNSLCAAALAILVVSPAGLHDVGLQLSFICVASLIAFANPLNPIDRHLHHRLYSLFAIILASLIATGTSWILTAYHFNVFPISFLPANLLVLPVLPIYIVLAMIYITFHCLGGEVAILGRFLDMIHERLTAVLEFLEGHFASVHLDIPAPAVALWLCAIVLAAIYIHGYRRRYVAVAGSALAVLAVAFILLPGRSNYINDGFIIMDDFRNLSIKVRIDGKDNLLNLRRGMISGIDIGGKKIIAVDLRKIDNHNIKLSSDKFDYLVVAGGYNGNLSDLCKTFSPGIIIIHRSVGRKKESAFLQEGASLGIPVHSIRKRSSLKVAFR